MIRRFALALGVLTTALLVFVAGPAGADQGVQIRNVDTAGFPNVLVTVAVPGSVTAGDVRLTEDGYPVDVVTARSLADAGGSVQIVLAIDTSNSVRGEALTTAVQAATTFVQQLPPGIPVGLLTFSDRPRVLATLQADHGPIVAALEGLTETQSGTTMYDGLDAAATMFSGDGQRDIVLLSDGADTQSAGTLETAVAGARAAHAAVFTVGLGSKVDAPVLQGIATGTGGSYTPAARADLISIYQDLAQQLSHQLVIQYRSHAPGGVEVTVGVEANDGSDQRFVQLPAGAAPPTESVLHRLLYGPWGMVGLLVVFFVVVFAIGVVLAGSGSRARRDRELARRMSAPPPRPEAVVRSDQGPTSWIPGSLASVGEAVAEVGGFQAKLERKLERAGLAITPGEFVTVSVGAVLIAGLIGGLLLRSVLWSLVLVGVAVASPQYMLGRRLRRRIDAIHAQLPDVLMILASSMRAGHSFLQALDTVSKEVGEPSGPEFARVVSEMRLGRSPDDALTALGQRVDTEEFRWAMMAVNVQREVGGNLAELLDTLATTVRERQVVRRQVRVLSAEGRLSMWLLAAIPPGLALYIAWVNPTYMRLLWTTKIGYGLIALGLILMSVGVLVARKIVRIDV